MQKDENLNSAIAWLQMNPTRFGGGNVTRKFNGHLPK